MNEKRIEITEKHQARTSYTKARAEYDTQQPPHSPSSDSTHRKLQEKQRKTEQMARALHIGNDYQDGEAFDRELQDQKRNERKQRLVDVERERLQRQSNESKSKLADAFGELDERPQTNGAEPTSAPLEPHEKREHSPERRRSPDRRRSRSRSRSPRRSYRDRSPEYRRPRRSYRDHSPDSSPEPRGRKRSRSPSQEPSPKRTKRD